MTIARHPLVFPYNTREPNAYNALGASKDNRMVGVAPQIVSDPIKGEKSAYAMKRLGLSVASFVSPGNYGSAIYNGTAIITAFATTANLLTPTVFYNGTDCGAVATNEIIDQIIQIVRSGVTYYIIPASTNISSASGYFLASDSVSDTTCTGDTHTNTIIDNIAGMTDTLYPGQPISGAGIQAGTRIASVTSATAIVTTIATTASASITITKTHLAKIIDTDFPTNPVGSFVDMDGYLFVMDSSSNIWNSDLNSVYSWSAASFIPANIKSGLPRGCAKVGNMIFGMKSQSIEFFRNTGNPFGSVLSRADPLYIDFGVHRNAAGAAVMTTIENTLYFISNGEDGRTGIFVMNGTTPTHISPPFIDSLVPDRDTAAIVSFSGNVIQGYKVLYMNGGTSDVYFGGTSGIAFYPELGIVTEPGFPFDFFQNRGGFISRSTTTGKVYLQNSITQTPDYQDDSANFDCVLQFDSGDKGSGKEKTVTYLELICDTAAAGSGATAVCAYSDNDGVSFTNMTQQFDLTLHQKRITSVPSYTGSRIYRVTVTGANRAWRGRFLDEDYTVGAQ